MPCWWSCLGNGNPRIPGQSFVPSHKCLYSRRQLLPQNRPCSEVQSATQTMLAFQEGQSVCFPIWQGLLPPSSMHLLLEGKLSIQMTNRPCLGQQEENKAGGRHVQDLIRNMCLLQTPALLAGQQLTIQTTICPELREKGKWGFEGGSWGKLGGNSWC